MTRIFTAAIGHSLLQRRTCPEKISERKQRRRHQQATAHQCQTTAEETLYSVLEKNTDDCHRNARHQYLAHIREIIVTTPCEETHTQRHEFTPQNDYRAQHRGHMQRRVKLQCLRTRKLQAKHLPAYLKMTARTYRQVFGQSLDQTEYQSIYPIHHSAPSSCLLLLARGRHIIPIPMNMNPRNAIVGPTTMRRVRNRSG